MTRKTEAALVRLLGPAPVTIGAHRPCNEAILAMDIRQSKEKMRALLAERRARKVSPLGHAPKVGVS